MVLKHEEGTPLPVHHVDSASSGDIIVIQAPKGDIFYFLKHLKEFMAYSVVY